MLAVKKLCDLQKALRQAETGQGTLRRKHPAAPDIFPIEPPDEILDPSVPHTPRMLTFQDSELSAELQNAMASHYSGPQEDLAFKTAAVMSVSQESIDARSRGSGRSQENPLTSSSSSPVTPLSLSHDCLLSSEQPIGSPTKERNIPEGRDQLQRFKYATLNAKPRPGTNQKASWSYLHSNSSAVTLTDYALGVPKKRTQSLTRYALSDGEPEDDDDDAQMALPAPVALPSYATLSRRPARGHLTRMHSTPEPVSRSHSFAIRTRRKGPPPPPPKRLSSVSSTSGTAENAPAPNTPPSPLDTSVKAIAATLENTFMGYKVESGQEVSRRRFASQSDSVESERVNSSAKGANLDTSPQSSSSECIPFAEEGNLTIKQRPKAGKTDGVSDCPDKPKPAKDQELPEFNLKESDTVKRRHKPKEKEQAHSAGDEKSQQVHLCIDESETPVFMEPPSVQTVKMPPPLAPKPTSPSKAPPHDGSIRQFRPSATGEFVLVSL